MNLMLDNTMEAWPYWRDLCPDRWDLFLMQEAGKCPGGGHLTKEEFLKWFPMFADAPEEWIEMLLKQTRCAFNTRVWGCWLKWGEALFVAHFLSMREMHLLPGEELDGNGGTLTGISTSIVSFKAGSVSYTKDTSIEQKLVGEPMLQTVFGQQLLDMIRSRIARGLVMVT